MEEAKKGDRRRNIKLVFHRNRCKNIYRKFTFKRLNMEEAKKGDRRRNIKLFFHRIRYKKNFMYRSYISYVFKSNPFLKSKNYYAFHPVFRFDIFCSYLC